MLKIKQLLSTPTEKLGRASRFLVFQIKLWSHCIRLLKQNRAGQQAAALSYHTLFGLVPLAIVTLLIFQTLPAYTDIADKVKFFIYDELQLSTIKYTPDEASPQDQVLVVDHFDTIIDSFFTGMNKGRITVFSLFIVIWAALALLSTIERAFNNIWHVTRGRGLIQRIINYWALLTLGPLLIGLGMYLSSQYSPILHLRQTLVSYATPVFISYLIALAALFLLYFILPNTKVQVRAALWGAAVSALAWVAAKNLFTYYITEFKPFTTVYGVMALIPITVFWIYATWLIVLFGLQLTFTTQHLKSLDAAEIAAAKKTEAYFIANDMTVINIVREIARGFHMENAPVESQVIFSRLNIPPEFGERIIHQLVESGIILKTTEPRAGYAPARSPESIRVAEICEIVAKSAFAQTPSDMGGRFEQLSESQKNALAGYTIQQLL